ncbi:MAG: YkgJ family cysteine cluster protein [Bdellovibrionales bacterium]|nr:YkgJ family cysteine cluster protein [Bdellovibrionales bacterium]
MKKKWYDNGIKFQCQGSGKCCTSHGEYGYVYLTLKDRRRMAKLLNISTSAFTKKYCEKERSSFYLKEKKNSDGSINPDCLFLENKKCSVYEARPTQCRTWPFWPDTLNAKTWSKEVLNFCPGVNKGRLYSKKEIEEICLEEQIAEKEIFR